jgi:hypothetical protein
MGCVHLYNPSPIWMIQAHILGFGFIELLRRVKRQLLHDSSIDLASFFSSIRMSRLCGLGDTSICGVCKL